MTQCHHGSFHPVANVDAASTGLVPAARRVFCCDHVIAELQVCTWVWDVYVATAQKANLGLQCVPGMEFVDSRLHGFVLEAALRAIPARRVLSIVCVRYRHPTHLTADATRESHGAKNCSRRPIGFTTRRIIGKHIGVGFDRRGNAQRCYRVYLFRPMQEGYCTDPRRKHKIRGVLTPQWVEARYLSGNVCPCQHHHTSRARLTTTTHHPQSARKYTVAHSQAHPRPEERESTDSVLPAFRRCC